MVEHTALIDKEAQEWEREWWGDCVRTFGEEAKQLTYAHLMGLVNTPHLGHWPVYDLAGKSVLDLGGGPVSMLLKCINGGSRAVVDPCAYPLWVADRYVQAGISYFTTEAETFNLSGDGHWDEVWLYNVLQHTIDPEEIIKTAGRSADTLRIFEWIETETNIGHPHCLHADRLNDWIGGVGQVGQVNQNGAVGLAYWGCFPL